MKNQNDLILIIVAFLIAAIGVTAIYLTKPQPMATSVVEQPILQPVQAPSASVTMTNSLPGGGGQSSSGGPAAGAGKGKAPAMSAMGMGGGATGTAGPSGPAGLKPSGGTGQTAGPMASD